MKTIEELLDISKATKPGNCDQHGVYESRNVFGSRWSTCPACANIAAEQAKKEASESAKALELMAWQRKIKNSGIPERFQRRSLNNFVADTPAQEAALVFATRYADGFDDALDTGRSSLFIGKPGTGKTHLAIGIGLRVMHRDKRTVLFTTVMRAIRSVKDTWGRDSQCSETEAIEALVKPDLLILDEVGVQFGSETEKLIMFDVLNERYEKRRPTLLLSNLTIDEVKTYLGERVFDRLREDGGEAITFDWESYRGKAIAA